MVIGETFGDVGYVINGVVVNRRSRADKICLWTAYHNAKETTLKIGLLCVKIYTIFRL